jgi:hypothetical protein
MDRKSTKLVPLEGKVIACCHGIIMTFNYMKNGHS